MIKELDQTVIEKCIEVLACANDGNSLTQDQLAEIQWLSNNYHRLCAGDQFAALASLDKMMVKNTCLTLN